MSAFDSKSLILKTIDADSNVEFFKCMNFNANEALGCGVSGRRDLLEVTELELDQKFQAKEIGEVEIGSCREDRALCFGVISSACIESS